MSSAFGMGLSFGAIALSACSRPQPAAGEVRIAAATDLAGTLEELAGAFERRTGTHVTISFGASGLLTKQLEQGAPFDAFAAADASFADRAARSGACDGATSAPYARGRIAVFVRDDAGGPLASLDGLRDARFRRIAIANPETAPYGRAAREALERSELWEELKPRIVYGENVRQTLQMAESGNAEAAIVAFSHARRAKGGKVLEVDTKLYAPLIQVVVACKRGKNPTAGAEFARALLTAEARDVFLRGGFLPPSEGGR